MDQIQSLISFIRYAEPAYNNTQNTHKAVEVKKNPKMHNHCGLKHITVKAKIH